MSINIPIFITVIDHNNFRISNLKSFKLSHAVCPHSDLSMDSLQSLSSDSATLAMQQAMLGADDSMDGTEEEEDDEEEEDEEEEEEEEDEREEGRGRGRQMSNAGRRDLSMELREDLE